MRCTSCCYIVMVAMLLLFCLPAMAGPVSRGEAFSAATVELPNFFAGEWKPERELPLYTLSGDVAAFLFIFSRTTALPQVKEHESAEGFVAKARAGLAARGRAVTGLEPELRGEDRYASIVISADDVEPPVIRCFLGLPFQVVRKVDAQALAEGNGGGAWRIRHCLLLGFFDEAFMMEPATGTGDGLVVDLRMRVVVPEKDARARAVGRQAAAHDPDLVRLSQKAWEPYRVKHLHAGGIP